MVSLLAAFQFLTLIPPIIKRPFKPGELGRSVSYYPLVGLVLGGVLYGANLGLSTLFPPVLRASLVSTLWVVLVGAFHFDGLLDTLDGIFGGFTPQKRLEIMRDEQVGAFGLTGGTLLLLIKFSALVTFPPTASSLLLVPTLSRWGMAFALFGFPYARKEGLGSTIKKNVTWRQFAFASFFTLPPAWIIAGGTGLAACILVLALTWLIARFVITRIPGLTGDVYGAINEVCEVFLLLLFMGIDGR